MDDSFTIQISSNLVNKLARDDGHKLKKKVKKPKPKIPDEPVKPQTEAKPASPVPKSSPDMAWPVQSPVFFPVPATPPPVAVALAELEAIRAVVKQSEDAVKRLEKQEADMVQELTQKAKELRDKEFKLPYQKSIPCLAEKEACLECYKKHQTPSETLKCAPVVRSFADCARQSRLKQQVGSKA